MSLFGGGVCINHAQNSRPTSWEVHLGLDGRQGAIILGPDLDPDDGWRAASGRRQDFLARHHEPDRAAGLLRAEGGQDIDSTLDLTAEPTAQLHRNHFDPRPKNPREGGQLDPNPECATGRGPDGHVIVALQRAAAAAGSR